MPWITAQVKTCPGAEDKGENFTGPPGPTEGHSAQNRWPGEYPRHVVLEPKMTLQDAGQPALGLGESVGPPGPQVSRACAREGLWGLPALSTALP